MLQQGKYTQKEHDHMMENGYSNSQVNIVYSLGFVY